MGLRDLIQLAAFLALLLASSGHLSEVASTVRKAQLQVIKEGQSTKWGRPFLPDTVYSD